MKLPRFRAFHIPKKFWWAVPIPEIKQYIGRFIKVTDDNHQDRIVEIEKILGNLTHKHMFEIHAKGHAYLVSMLDFYAQMNGEKVSQEEIAAFNETTFEVTPNNPEKIVKEFKDKLWKPKDQVN